MHHLPDEVLYAFADERLPEAERQEATEHLRACAVCRARLARSRAVTRALKDWLGQEHAPSALRASIQRQVARQAAPPTAARMGSRLWLSAAAFGIGVLMFTTAYFVYTLGGAQTPSLLAQLAEAHANLAQSAVPLQVRGDAATVSDWFTSALQQPVQSPAIEGMLLVGGRIDLIEGERSAHLVYQQPDDGAQMSLLLWRGSASLGEFTQQAYESGYFYVGTWGEDTVVIWPVGGVRYACIGGATAERVLDMAGKVRRSLTN